MIHSFHESRAGSIQQGSSSVVVVVIDSLISEPDVATPDAEEISVDPVVVTGAVVVRLVHEAEEIRLRVAMYVPVMTAGTVYAIMMSGVMLGAVNAFLINWYK